MQNFLNWLFPMVPGHPFLSGFCQGALLTFPLHVAFLIWLVWRYYV